MKTQFECANVLRSILLLIVMTALCGCATQVVEKRESSPDGLMSRIWPDQPSPKRVLSESDQRYAERALTRWLEVCLYPDYEIVEQRFFWLPPKYTSYAAIGGEHGNRIRSEEWGGAVEIDSPCYTLGYNPVNIWKINFEGKTRYFAISMTHDPVSGAGHRPLFGRFELRKTSVE